MIENISMTVLYGAVPQMSENDALHARSVLPVVENLVGIFQCLNLILPLLHTLCVSLFSLNAHGGKLLEFLKGCFFELLSIVKVILRLDDSLLSSLLCLLRVSFLLRLGLDVIIRFFQELFMVRNCLLLLLCRLFLGALEVRLDHLQDAENALGRVSQTLVLSREGLGSDIIHSF